MENGGKRAGAGRKPKIDEQKANYLFATALRELYDTDIDDEAKVKFIKETLMSSQRGQIFIAEHVFGKPKETIENINKNFEAGKLTEEEIIKIKNTLVNAY